jgi:hypothetical protein
MWWEIDCTYYILLAMQWLGIIWDLHTVPVKIPSPSSQKLYAPRQPERSSY